MYDVSPEFLTKIKEPSRTIDAIIGLGSRDIINMVGNGNFVGTTGWVGTTIIDFTATNNEATFTATAQYGKIRSNVQTLIIDHIYYVRAILKDASSNVGLTVGLNATPYTVQSNTYMTLSGEYETVSGYFTSSETNATYYTEIIDYRTSAWTPINVKEVMLIDLTTTYGEGNEPTKVEMDNIIDMVGWFTNTTTTISDKFLTTDTIINFDIESSFGSNNIPTIGGVIGNKLSLDIINDASLPVILINIPIVPYIKIEISTSIYESVKLGTFYAEYSDIVKSKNTVEIDAFDIMPNYDTFRYDTILSYPATIQVMLTELTTNYGIIFASQTLPSVSFDVAPTGTVRQVIGMIASLITTNATINANGEVEFRFLTSSGFGFNSDNYIDFKLTSDAIIKISQLTIPTDEGETEIFAGDGTGFALQFENDAITSSADLQVVFDREFPLEFYAYDLKAQGMPHLQVGDYIEFTDVNLIVRTLAIVNHIFSFNGGMSSNFKVDAPKQPTTEITVTGGSTLSKAISKSYVDLNIAIANATGLITGSQGGYLKTLFDPTSGLPSELVILDNEDVDLATNVWRWNKSGFGYSSTGFNGSYGLAMTSDGQIVADFITTGTINGASIKLGGVGNEGVLVIYDAVNDEIGRLDTDGVNFSTGKFSIQSWTETAGWGFDQQTGVGGKLSLNIENIYSYNGDATKSNAEGTAIGDVYTIGKNGIFCGESIGNTAYPETRQSCRLENYRDGEVVYYQNYNQYGDLSLLTTGDTTWLYGDKSMRLDAGDNADVNNPAILISNDSSLSFPRGFSIDGVENDILLNFNTERPWTFKQGSTGATTSLDLQSSSDSKSFKILANDGNPLFIAMTSQVPTSQYVNIYNRLNVVGDINVSGTIIQDDWIYPSMGNNWVNYGGLYITLRYRKDSCGYVHLYGMIKDGTAGTVFTLPVGYRSSTSLIFGIGTSTETGMRTAFVNSNGTVIINNSVGDTWASLSGIRFYANA